MIDQINKNANRPNVYASFQTNDVRYAIYTPITKEEKKETEVKKTNALGYSIAVTALLLGFGTLALVKGMPKGARIRFDKFSRYLDEKIETIAEKNKNASTIQSTTLNALKGIKSVAGKARAIYNIGPLKDVWVKVQSKKIPILNKIFDSITGFYEGISVRKAEHEYEASHSQFNHMFANFADINLRIPEARQNEPIKIKTKSGFETKTIAQWLQALEQLGSHAMSTYNKDFGLAKQRQRLNAVKQSISTLDTDVYHSLYTRDIFKNKINYQKFISEEFASHAKEAASENVENLRRAISNNVDDNYAEITGLISKIENAIGIQNKEQRNLVRTLKNTSIDYRIINGPKEEIERKALIEKMSEQLTNLASNISDSNKYKGTNATTIQELITKLRDVLQTREKGTLEEILTIYKAILPKEEYKLVQKSYERAAKSFRNSIHTETDKLFDKLRDFQVGAAILDTLSFLLALGSIGLGLGKADNKDERISAGLRYGIPALGAIGTVLYCTTRLISGGAAIITGLGSGYVIGKIGDYIDEKRKEIMNRPITLDRIAASGISLINPNAKTNKST